MGFKFDSRSIRCPLFCNVVCTDRAQFLGVECEQSLLNLGFDVTHITRFRNRSDLKDYTDIFCRDLYKTCPYYQEYCRECGIDG